MEKSINFFNKINETYFNKNILILFIILSLGYYKLNINNMIWYDFILDEIILFCLCWFLVNDIQYRYLKKIDNGREINFPLNWLEYVLLLLGISILIISVFTDQGVYTMDFSIIMIYFVFKSWNNIYIGENFIYIYFEAISIKKIKGYRVDNEEITFELKDGKEKKLKIKNNNMIKQIKKIIELRNISEYNENEINIQ